MHLVFDAHKRTVGESRRALTHKQFSLMLLLALRASDETFGWVSTQEVVDGSPWWHGMSPEQAGKQIWRYADEPWFEGHVIAPHQTIGPYRLDDLFTPAFLPSREAAVAYLADTPVRGSGSKRASRVTLAELRSYDMLVQYGVFFPSVVDLVTSRLTRARKSRDPEVRLLSTKVLCTLHKLRDNFDEAEQLADEGLRLAERQRARDEVAYFLDQRGCIAYKRGDLAVAQTWFEKEREYCEAWGTDQATFHLVGAWRGLASVYRRQGRIDEAENAVAQSKQCAEQSGNDDGYNLAMIEEARLSGGMADGDKVAKILMSLPAGHVVAQQMVRAEHLLAKLREREE